jgi:hypothetical protein
VRPSEVVDGRRHIERQLDELDADSREVVTVVAIVAFGNPPNLALEDNGLVPARRCELE